MRAVTVRVNDVVGVAGFVLPGMRVDVMITGHPPGNQTIVTKTVLQNITVLSAGQNMQSDATGKPVDAPSVTMLVTLAQAEMFYVVLDNTTNQCTVMTNEPTTQKTRYKTLGKYATQDEAKAALDSMIGSACPKL